MTVVEMAHSYVEIVQREREQLLKQITETNTRVQQYDQHLNECRECLAAQVPALAPAPDDVTLADE